MSQQHICPQKPHTYHICQILHVMISKNCVSIYTSYELNAMNNVTRSTGIHVFHITALCPWTNMPPTLYKYIPLHIYYRYTPHYCIYPSKIIHWNIILPNYCKIGAITNYALPKPHAQITVHASIEDVCQYICHIWTQWNQSCDQGWCNTEDNNADDYADTSAISNDDNTTQLN